MCRRHHDKASQDTSSRVPGSSNDCVAPGTISRVTGARMRRIAKAIELDDRLVGAAHDQKRRRVHAWQRVTRQVRASSA
jgi:hypothetical protein